MFKRKISLIVICCVILVLIFSFVGFLRRHYVIPILMYHSVSYVYNPVMNRLIVSPKTFERQMGFLKKHNYNVLSLEKAADIIKNKKDFPPRSVVITLDDGYKDNYVYAYPILKKYNLPATIFVIINEIGRPGNDRLSWEEIKEMSDSGIISIGSHCLGPEPLVNIKSEEEVRKEIFYSKKILEQKLGKRVLCFSYPEGMFNPQIKDLVKQAGYHVAVATSPGRQSADDDMFALKRLRISENAANLFIFWFESSGIYTYLKERKKK